MDERREVPNADSSFGVDLHNFLTEVEGLRATFPLVTKTLDESATDANERLSDFVLRNGLGKVDERVPNQINVNRPLPLDHWRNFYHLSLEDQRHRTALVLVHRAMFTSLVSQFDAFVGRLVKNVVRHHPGVMGTDEGSNSGDSRQNSIPFEKLTDFASIEEAKEYIVDRFVTTVMRKSHTEQFRWLEQRLGMPLKKDLQCWPSFVELTQRRHLFVHSNGVVTSEYLDACRCHGVVLEEGIGVGSFLGLDKTYFKVSSACVLEIGIKLGHVLWRKLIPAERSNAEANFTEICFQLIRNEDYEIAIELLSFSFNTPPLNSLSEEWRLANRLNLAQALKWARKDDLWRKELGKEDWHSKRDKFQLGAHVLQGEFIDAVQVVKRMGKDELQASDYRSWPIFRELREQETFRVAFHEVFGEPLEIVNDTVTKMPT